MLTSLMVTQNSFEYDRRNKVATAINALTPKLLTAFFEYLPKMLIGITKSNIL